MTTSALNLLCSHFVLYPALPFCCRASGVDEAADLKRLASNARPPPVTTLRIRGVELISGHGAQRCAGLVARSRLARAVSRAERARPVANARNESSRDPVVSRGVYVFQTCIGSIRQYFYIQDGMCNFC